MSFNPLSINRWIVTIVCGVFLTSLPAMGADQDAVNEAIKKAMAKMWEEQFEDGSWEYRRNDEMRALGMTALIALAQYENGTLPTDPRLRAALKYVRENANENTDTYSVSLATILLARVGNREDRALVRSLAAKLVAGQHATGSWGYTVPVLRRDQERDRTLRRPPASQIGDLSVTQFAVLALWQAQQVGANVEDSLQKVRQRLAWGQTKTGGWSYHGLPNDPDSASMTAAGAYMWLVASAWEIKEARRKKIDKIVPRQPRPRTETIREKLRQKADAAQDQQEKSQRLGRAAEAKDAPPADVYDALARAVVEYREQVTKAPVGDGGDALKRLDAEIPNTLPPDLEVSKPNPLVADAPLNRALERCGHFASTSITAAASGFNWLYYVWSVERLGVIIGRDTFGSTNWFEVGAKTLLSRQNADGSWGVTRDDPMFEKALVHFLPDTAFALLFLKKANLGSEITKLLTADPDRPFYVEGRTGTRYDKLEAALAAASAKDTIVVEGDGPFATAAVILDKPITIRATQGYRPVFTYRRPKDRLGADVNPAERPETKNLFVVKAGPVVLEGLALQMDAPASASKIDWALIDCAANSEIRLLNCSLSESTRGASIGVSLNDTPRVFIRNTLFVGFNPAIRIQAAKQCNILLKDCVAYGLRSINATGPGALNLWMYESTIHAEKAFDLSGLAGPASIVAENNVFKADQLVAQVAAAGAKRTFDGNQLNLYDVRQWIGSGDARAAAIQELAAWRKHWQTSEKNSHQGGAPFAVARLQIGSFRHETTAGDWALDFDALKRMMRFGDEDQIGANVYLVGAGDRYVQFRDSQEYANWFRGVTRPSERTKTD